MTPIATVTPKKVRLFPLHKTSFEHYMIADDRPNYPMVFIVELELSGDLNQQALNDAIATALPRHPLLTAVIGPGKQGKDCWIKAPNPQPTVDWGGLNDPIEFPNGEHINLREEVGLRIFIRRDEQRSVITTQFHHAACDGIGAYQFLGDVLHQYALNTGDTTLPPLYELPPRRIKARGQAGYDLNNFRTASGKIEPMWDEALKTMLRGNIVITAPTKKPANFARPFPGIQSFVFDKKEYKALRLAAQTNGQMVNDMLLERLFETLFRWSQKHRSFNLRKHICVMMPLNLRERTEHDISACNIVAQSFIRRTGKEIQDKQKLRKGLAAEVLKLKHSRHHVRFTHMIAGGHYFYPGILKRSLDFKRNMATAILSNTGDPTKQFYVDLPREKGLLKCGNMTLEAVSGVPPLRPGTNATVSIFTYRRELKICLRCDPNQFSDTDTGALLEMYVECIRSGVTS